MPAWSSLVVSRACVPHHASIASDPNLPTAPVLSSHNYRLQPTRLSVPCETLRNGGMRGHAHHGRDLVWHNHPNRGRSDTTATPITSHIQCYPPARGGNNRVLFCPFERFAGAPIFDGGRCEKYSKAEKRRLTETLQWIGPFLASNHPW